MEPTVDEIFIAVDCALEDANRHSENTDTWAAVAPFIDPEKQLAAAKAYANSIASGWEDYLDNVVSYTERRDKERP